MSVASEIEQEMLALINNERAIAGLDPLAFNGRLNDASEVHSQWMLDVDVLSHRGAGGSSPTERMEDAGYVFEGAWSSGENVAYQSERGEPGLSDDVADLHAGLMNSPGHRANILNPDFTEIGIGIELGDWQTSGNVFDAVVVTQNFATSAADNADDPAPTAPDDDQIAQPDDPVDDPDDGDTPVPGDDIADGGDDVPWDDGDDMADGGDDVPGDDDDDMADGCSLDLDTLIAALGDAHEIDGAEMFEFSFGGETWVGYAVDADLLLDGETPAGDVAGDDDPVTGGGCCWTPCDEVSEPAEDMAALQARAETELAASYGDCIDIV